MKNSFIPRILMFSNISYVYTYIHKSIPCKEFFILLFLSHTQRCCSLSFLKLIVPRHIVVKSNWGNEEKKLQKKERFYTQVHSLTCFFFITTTQTSLSSLFYSFLFIWMLYFFREHILKFLVTVRINNYE